MLERALTAALAQRPADLIVDLAAVGFACVGGFAHLAVAATTAQTGGIGVAVSGMPPHLDRIATLLWPVRPWIHYRSVTAAATATRIDQTHRLSRSTSAPRPAFH